MLKKPNTTAKYMYEATVCKQDVPSILFVYTCCILQLTKSIRLNLNKLIEEKGISKTKLCYRAELQRTQLNNYCNNDITRLDVDILARD